MDFTGKPTEEGSFETSNFIRVVNVKLSAHGDNKLNNESH